MLVDGMEGISQGRGKPRPYPATMPLMNLVQSVRGLALVLTYFTSMRAGKFDKVLHHLRVAHGVYADGFLQGDAHEQLFHGDFQFFAVERARHFGDGDDLIGYVVRR